MKENKAKEKAKEFSVEKEETVIIDNIFYCHNQSPMKHNRCIKQCDMCQRKQ